MKANRIILFFVLLLLSINLVAQNSDTLPLNKRNFEYEYDLKFRNTIIPAVLISYGIIGFDNPHLKSWNLGIRSEVLEHINTKYRADDYFQYAPGLAVYILDDAGLKAKHSFWDRTAVLTGSFLLQTAVVQTLKYTTNVMRPDSSATNSFPSGHTTLAFSGAEFLWQEYKDHSIWIGVSGYLVASTIGFARVINNKHWVTDVVAGAGIGILSTKISYFAFERLKFKKNKTKKVVALVSPYYDSKSKGLRFKMLF
ncbi:phosphatase PAP2 family protein [Tenuifilum thalassicum]|uniref:Phosphatase PAP2 family protein n=1 Tax=Tenuifilum thalassicum TaxID=2590900 RepID=A0A7D3XEY9_9BACT|nr:phosphatase PAP2 family protein [Tenuifilum thalassicum]QKG80347.1 phosphatase PAP2 family protein [Tenuifilum thalassicum]